MDFAGFKHVQAFNPSGAREFAPHKCLPVPYRRNIKKAMLLGRHSKHQAGEEIHGAEADSNGNKIETEPRFHHVGEM